MYHNRQEGMRCRLHIIRPKKKGGHEIVHGEGP
jgi:hypothetical protein